MAARQDRCLSGGAIRSGVKLAEINAKRRKFNKEDNGKNKGNNRERNKSGTYRGHLAPAGQIDLQITELSGEMESINLRLESLRAVSTQIFNVATEPSATRKSMRWSGGQRDRWREGNSSSERLWTRSWSKSSPRRRSDAKVDATRPQRPAKAGIVNEERGFVPYPLPQPQTETETNVPR